MWYPPFMGFRPISASRETTPCFSESERNPKTPTVDERNRRAVSCMPTCCQHAKPFTVEDNRKKFSTVEEPLISFNMPINQDVMGIDQMGGGGQGNLDNSLKSLKSIASVSNIHLYSEENGDLPLEELQAKPIIFEEDDNADESEDETTEVDDEISQDTATAELHYPHQLSVIYEENDESLNNERRASVCSRSSTLSDCSTTLMEEDNISVDYSGDELEEENSNSVTVRLPLKFSFTRSGDNLVNTTLTVGESESEVTENNSSTSKSPEILELHSPRTKSPEAIEPPSPPKSGHVSKENSAADVSVTFRLKSKSRTPERIITPNLSLFNNNSFDSDPECSVSISLPRKSKTKELSTLKVPENTDDISENSADNKNNIDSSLYTSIDALEEIKKGMAEITNSLFSRICTLRKSALNIPENDPHRSSSTSQIESIDTDSDNDLSLSLSFDDFRMENKNQKTSEPLENGEDFPTECSDLVNVEDSKVDNSENNEADVDFWSELSIANKNFDDPDAPHLSKTSTRSSRYWFEDDCEEEIKNTEAEKIENVCDEKSSQIDEPAIEPMNSNESKNVDVDFWHDYDDNRGAKFRANDYFVSQESSKEILEGNCNGHELNENVESNGEKSELKSEIVHSEELHMAREDLLVNEVLNIKPESKDTDEDDELASDEEWTEEEIEPSDNAEPQTQPPTEIPQENIAESTQTVDAVEDESEYEDESYESEEEDEENAQQLVQPPKAIEVQQENKVEEESFSEESEDEGEDDDERSSIPECNKSSSSKIVKGKSLVNVNSYVTIGSNSRDKVQSMVQSINEAEDSEESEYSSAEEDEMELNEALPATSSNNLLKHSNDDCQLLTRIQTSHEDKVLQHALTTIQSLDSKSNLTSESGISFEHHDPDSDGYEEDSDDEAPPEDDKTVTKETQEDAPENEIKINVRGKISMFERAMSEEPAERSVKEVPRVPAKYSFKHRESSEPPMQKPSVIISAAVPQRAVSEVKEFSKNQKLADRVNQRKSLPPMTEIEADKQRKSVKERISSIETSDSDANEKRETFKRYGNSKKSIPLVRSIDESGEEDSGVTSDFCKQFSENETDSENFPELRKLSRYQRASTHSRLFKLLQGDEDEDENDENAEAKEVVKVEPAKIPYKSKKIIHNVSVTRRQNPKAALEAETMEERRQRLCLPLSHQSSSGAESMSSSTTPSPTPGVINEKLVNELVQSLLCQKKGRAFKNLPIEKLHAAAVKILQEDMESNGTLSSADESTIPTVDSTPALTPQEFRNNSSYAEYYDSWENKNELIPEDSLCDLNLVQSKAFKNLQDQQSNANKKLWSVRCPRILSSKSINKDLARLSEVRESESPEPNHSRSPSIRSLSADPMSGENFNNQDRQKAKNCYT